MAKNENRAQWMRQMGLKGGLLLALVMLLIACVAKQSPHRSEEPPLIGTQQISNEELNKFEPEIRRFDSLLLTELEPKGGIVFAGSSSIRKWDSLVQDMEPLPVVNRGFGGAIIKQVTHQSTRMIVPLRPKLIVFYCGENDIANDVYPAEMPLTDFKAFTRSMRQKLPGTGILFISLKPSPLRWKYWAKFQATNRLVKDYIQTQDRMWYADVSVPMLNEKGLPRPELFASDSLHMSPAGYALWKRVLKPVVAQHFDGLSQN